MSCPICGKPVREERRPFCSKRCADVDLGRWLGGHYAVLSQDSDDIETAMAKFADSIDTPPDNPDKLN